MRSRLVDAPLEAKGREFCVSIEREGQKPLMRDGKYLAVRPKRPRQLEKSSLTHKRAT